ncbi:MAG: hypothetical protein V1731_00565, partial [Candidatus Aenigmatarchaeota archaeon]
MKWLVILVLLTVLMAGCTQTAPSQINQTLSQGNNTQNDQIPPKSPTEPFARQTHVEVVTNNAAVFNPKGGQQTRIVRTQDGVFTAYIVEHNGDFDHEWQLSKRQSDGTWVVIAQGDAGT